MNASLRRPFLLSLALLAVVGCSRPAAAADVVARVGTTEVTLDELRGYIATLGAQEQSALAKDPALLSQVVRTYLARQAVLREAQAKKFDQQPATQQQLARVRDQALTELYLQSVARTPDGYPSDAELEAAYRAHPALFAVPKRWRVAQVFVAVPKGSDAAAQEKARKKVEEIARKAKAKGADFAALARAETEEKGAAERGGEIGWLADAEMVPEVRRVVTALSVNSVSDAVRLDDGWHVLKLLEVREAGTRPLPEVKESLAAQLRAEKAQALRQAYLAKLLEQNPPAINELALSRAVAAAK
jgi:peptidylprolyl isomerase